MTPDASHSGAKYRPEIDGLRAIAVVPVILFHAGAGAFKGGYLGVDVFFVISGYLITSIILGDLAAGRFTIASFYERRARRILPALFVVVAACVPFALAWMLPTELLHFARSMLATLSFVPNIFYWHTTSYFAFDSQLLPLLHTWSLGVEEQFYVFFPLVVALAWRFGPRAVVVTVAVLALCSFGLAEWAWRTGRASASFYLLPTRAWELMVGAAVAAMDRSQPLHQRVPPAVASGLAMLGLAGVGLSMATFDEATPMPSYWGLVPVLGTAMVIAFTAPGSLLQRALGQRQAVAVGLVSYSAYLWHQPLLAFARMHVGRVELEAVQYLPIVALTFALAWLTWRFVEAPFRQRKVVDTRRLVRFSLAGAATLATIAAVGEVTRGLPARLSPENRALAAMADSEAMGRYVLAAFKERDAPFSGRPVQRILVIGDSYGEDFVNSTLESGLQGDFEIRTRYLSENCQVQFGAPPDPDDIPAAYQLKCQEMRATAGQRDRIEQADLVVLAGRWRPWAVDQIQQTLAALGLRPDQKSVVVGAKHFGIVNFRRYLELDPDQRSALRQAPLSTVAPINARLKALLGPGRFVDIEAAACDGADRCRIFTPQAELISFDGTHLTPEGARWLGRAIWSRGPLADWARQRGLTPPAHEGEP